MSTRALADLRGICTDRSKTTVFDMAETAKADLGATAAKRCFVRSVAVPEGNNEGLLSQIGVEGHGSAPGWLRSFAAPGVKVCFGLIVDDLARYSRTRLSIRTLPSCLHAQPSALLHIYRSRFLRLTASLVLPRAKSPAPKNKGERRKRMILK